MKIVQITDTHLTPRDARPANHQRVDPYLKLQNVFQDVEIMADKPDLIVISGDLVHEGIEFDYRKLHDIIDYQSNKLKLPVYVILGNHDRTEAFYRGYLKEEPRDKYYYSISTNECDIFFLDSKLGDLEQGEIDSTQLSWLQHELNNSTKNSSLIFIHHPIDGPSLRHMRYSILQNSREFVETIKGTNVRAVLSGHIHFGDTFEQDNILYSAADSSAYHINCDNHHNHLVMDSTCYDIITLEDDRVGVETRYLLTHHDIINQVPITHTGWCKE
ncbi:metallophosphoesterase family protein [Companilactobacillus hulinensis]|uniref:metallophosphoesterase family protein n=1 Tax=Companilactobacillus hulinensis TaxID=2486007 RepID=UPI000F7A5909|nr:metallophosphoesterase [Companilactobacillus hulinensis]